MLVKVVTELLGTFFFFAVILATAGSTVLAPLAIGLALASAIFMGGGVSGGHFNSAVSVMMFAKGDINVVTLLSYIVAQIAGGMLALWWYTMTLGA